MTTSSKDAAAKVAATQSRSSRRSALWQQNTPGALSRASSDHADVSIVASVTGRRADSTGSAQWWAWSASSFVPPAAFVGTLLLGWELLVRWFAVPSYVLPTPSAVVAALISNASVLVPHTATTLLESLVGLGLGAGAGVGLAVAMGMSRSLSRVIAPLLVVSQTVPIVILAPLLVLWFGFGITSKVVIVALMGFFPVAISMAGGLNGVAQRRLDLMEALGATRWQTMRHVRVPWAIPSAIDGLRIAAAYAIGGAIVGEWTGAQEGLGVFIDRSRASFRIDQVFAGVTVVAVLSVALFMLVGFCGKLIAPWHYRQRSTDQPANKGS